jgi:hypothetical protein
MVGADRDERLMAVKVKGLREFIRATDHAQRETKRLVREELAAAAEPVRAEAERRFSTIDAQSAAGYAVSVRRAGLVMVVQRLRKVTGLRPDYGALQMRNALLPALAAKEGQVEHRLERAVDEIADRMEGR